MRNRFHSEFPAFLSLALGLLHATPIFAWELYEDPFVVVDANNKLVGSFGGQIVLRNVNGVWVSLGFYRGGFSYPPSEVPPVSRFASTNCTGTKYFDATPTVPPMGTVVQSSNNTKTLYFHGLPVKLLTLRSSLLSPNRCIQDTWEGWFGPAQSVNLDDYKAPFAVKSVSQLKSEKAYQ